MYRMRSIKQFVQKTLSVSGFSRELQVVWHSCSEDRNSRKHIKSGIICHTIKLNFYSAGVEESSEGDKHRKENKRERKGQRR